MTEKLTEFIRSPEQVVVARILGQVHKAIDQNFPNSNASTSRQFAKTIHTPEELSQHHPKHDTSGSIDPLTAAGFLNKNLPAEEMEEKYEQISEGDAEIFDQISASYPTSADVNKDDLQFEGHESSWNLDGPSKRKSLRILKILVPLAIILGVIAYAFLTNGVKFWK